MSTNDSGAEKPTDSGIDQDHSRYVTVFHQLKDTENAERGDRAIVHGEQLDDRYILDDHKEDFLPVARPIAVIDIGAEITEDGLEDWCNSHAGKAILSQFFETAEEPDPTLPDVDEYLEVDGDE